MRCLKAVRALRVEPRRPIDWVSFDQSTFVAADRWRCGLAGAAISGGAEVLTEAAMIADCVGGSGGVERCCLILLALLHGGQA